MSDVYWKLKKSLVANKVPTVEQFDENTIVFNQADGVLYLLKIVNGVKTVVRFSGFNEIHDQPGLRITEALSGSVDCLNTVFSTSMPYQSGTISVFLNGRKWEDFTELSDMQIQFHSAPSNVGFTDTVHAIFTKKII